jgi:hypothetical protein
LYAVGSEGPAQAMMLFEKFDSIIVDLCDFCLQRDSPKAKDEKEKRVEMGGSMNKVQLGPVINLVSHLVRCKYTPQMLKFIENGGTIPKTVMTFEDRSWDATGKKEK